MLCEKLVDTPVRGLVYEGAGTLPDDVLAGGAEIVRARGGDVEHPGRGARDRSGRLRGVDARRRRRGRAAAGVIKWLLGGVVLIAVAVA